MRVLFKQAACIGKKDYSRGINEVPASVADDAHFQNLVRVGLVVSAEGNPAAIVESFHERQKRLADKLAASDPQRRKGPTSPPPVDPSGAGSGDAVNASVPPSPPLESSPEALEDPSEVKSEADSSSAPSSDSEPVFEAAPVGESKDADEAGAVVDLESAAAPASDSDAPSDDEEFDEESGDELEDSSDEESAPDAAPVSGGQVGKKKKKRKNRK